MRVRQRSVVLGLAVAVGGVLSVAAPAGASVPTFGALVPASFVEVFAGATVPESGVQSATARCPAGTAAVSVGGVVETTDGVVGITPGPDSASGVATARAGRGDVGRRVFAQVTCTATAQFVGTTVATREQSVHSVLGEWSQTVTCPAGMRAFGGGGYFRARNGTVSSDQTFMSVNAPTLNERGWTVSAVNNTFTDTLVVTTRCALQSSSTRLVEETYPMVAIPGTGVGRAEGYAHCPPGFLPISGGAQITQDGSPAASQSRLLSSLSSRPTTIDPSGWFARGISRGEHPVLHVVVLCGS